MTRGAGTTGSADKKPSRKAATPQRAPKTARSSPPATPSIDNLQAQLNEALAREAATGELLQVISRSDFDLQAVLDTLTKSAAQLCEAELASIYRPKGDAYYWATSYGYPPQLGDYMKNYPMTPGRGTAVARVLLEGKTVQISDALADPDYSNPEAQKLGGYRALLAVPLLREKTVIGVISLARKHPRPFTEKQIALVQNFAAQAVIAIENTGLLNELRQRTDDLSESLEQQTATSEVLKVISNSPGELEPVFQTMLKNAVRICQAKFGFLWRAERGEFRAVALHNLPPALRDRRQRQGAIRFDSYTPIGRAVSTKRAVHIPDISLDPAYARGFPPLVELAQIGGGRTMLVVPMLKEDEVIGAITIYRQEVRPFTEKQIELVQSFAAQAVIAIENTRLLNELRESLQQQTATADVLKVISRSTFDLQTVLDTLGRVDKFEPVTRCCDV
jgi:GAF domain-containing protein